MFDAYVPTGHFVQLDAPAVLFCPFGHAIQAVADVEPVFGLYVPAAQFVHCVLPVFAAYVPTGHIVHCILPVPDA